MSRPPETDEEFEAWAKAHFEAHAAIVDQLRSRGWERLDAIEEADRILSERAKREAQQ